MRESNPSGVTSTGLHDVKPLQRSERVIALLAHDRPTLSDDQNGKRGATGPKLRARLGSGRADLLLHAHGGLRGLLVAICVFRNACSLSTSTWRKVGGSAMSMILPPPILHL